MESVADLGTFTTGAARQVLVPWTTQNSSTERWGPDITKLEQRQIFTYVNNIFLCGTIGLFGIISNIINLVVFYKQGLDTTINISFFAMALSDLCCLIFQTWYIICVVPYFEQLRLPMVYVDVQFVTGGITRELFARITCLITAYVTAERCLCVAFPLRVKQIITPKRTTIIMIVLFLAPFASGIPMFLVDYLEWQYYPDLNQTLLGAVNPENKQNVEGLAFMVHAFLGVVSLIAVGVFTSILIRKLRQTSDWRQSVKGNQGKTDPTSKRDRATMALVALIAGILIISYIPAVAISVTIFCVPELAIGGKYADLNLILWSFALVFETINSSVNIFLYYRMSTKFRHTFREIFLVCGQRIPMA